MTSIVPIVAVLLVLVLLVVVLLLDKIKQNSLSLLDGTSMVTCTANAVVVNESHVRQIAYLGFVI